MYLLAKRIYNNSLSEELVTNINHKIKIAKHFYKVCLTIHINNYL